MTTKLAGSYSSFSVTDFADARLQRDHRHTASRPRRYRSQRAGAADARATAGARRPPTRVPAHGRVARVHFDRLGDGARLVGELLERELQLPRIDALRLLAKQALAQHVELMPQRRVLALDLGELLLERGDEGARRREILDVARARVRRLAHCCILRPRLDLVLTHHQVEVTRRAHTSADAACARGRRPRATTADRCCAGRRRVFICAGHANVPRSSRL